MTTTHTADVAIIGGGLGGLTLSIQLAKQGRKVVLFEKESYPYHKVCGEYIAMESYGFLEDCGIPLSTLSLPRINELQLSAPGGNALIHALNPGGFGISRYTLDSMLAQCAREAGVTLLTACKVNQVAYTDMGFAIDTSLGSYLAPFAFGAYGKKSNLDVKLNRSFTQQKHKGATNYLGVKYHIEYPQPQNRISLHNFEDGYCGISQIEAGKACLCYLTTAANLNKHGNSVEAMEKAVLHKNPHLRDIFQQARFLYEAPLTISQIRFEPKQINENHLLMLGDAAGLITPLCGNGMSMSMRAAHLIATLLPDNAQERAAFEQQYEKAWKREFGLRLKAGRTFQQLFGAGWVTEGVVGLLKTLPFLLPPLVRLTHGKKF